MTLQEKIDLLLEMKTEIEQDLAMIKEELAKVESYLEYFTEQQGQ